MEVVKLLYENAIINYFAIIKFTGWKIVVRYYTDTVLLEKVAGTILPLFDLLPETFQNHLFH